MPNTPDSSKKKSPQKTKRSKNSRSTNGTTTKTANTPEPENNSFPVIGIGASAGGLEAFEKLFTHLPANSGMALVIVQHLDPTHESILTDLIRRFTKMQVMQVKDQTSVQPNWVYVIPPNTEMALQDGLLHLAEPSKPRGLRLPIDHFFRSLATDQGEKAICVILSGTGTDGTLGLKAIKEEGGLAIAQTPDSARYNGMPISAINTGLVDMVLDPDKIGEQLIEYVKRSFGVAEQPIEKAWPEINDQLQRIFILLKKHTGHDFSGYKENTIVRRIERRMTVKQLGQVEDYLELLRQSPLEIETLFRELLIGVTSFFRDPQAFQAVEKKIIAPLFNEPEDNLRQIRVWVPGCSTGEEAYSIAILLQEQLERSKRPVEIQIFATDIDQEAIAKAREARYPDNITADVSPERLKRFFTRESNADFYQVKRQIRDIVVFAEQSVIKDPPFSKMDLICCRNLMIYLGPDLQQRLLSIFHYALNPGGYLFLGNSETLGESQKLYQTLDLKWKIFKRTEYAINLRTVLEFSREAAPKARSTSDLAEKPLNMRELTEKRLLDDYVPTSVLVNENGEMLYIHGHTGKYLEQSTGEVSTNIMRIAREGLRMPLSTAIRNANSQKKIQTAEGISIIHEGGNIRVNLTVDPILKPPSAKGLVLVTLTEIPPLEQPLETDEVDGADNSHVQRIAELEQELKSTGDYLQTVIEELETTNEELKASNEELQSANEELQSTNEELQTSKEELQSSNEELITVNTELKARVEDLIIANDDIKNLMESTRVGVIFLDTQLRIRRFTDASRDLVDLIPGDVGRPLRNFVHKLPDLDLMKAVQEVVTSQATTTIEVQGEGNQWYLLRIMPYRTVDNQIAGVVLTLTDVTELKQNEARLKAAVAVSGVGIYQHNVPIGPELYHSNHWAEMLGYTKEELPPFDQFMTWLMTIVHPEDVPALNKAYTNFIEGRTEQYEVEARMQHKAGHWVHVKGLSHALSRDAKGQVTKVIGVTLDVSEFRQVEQMLRRLGEHRYRELFTNSIVGIMLTQPNGTILHANPAACNMLGYSEAELQRGGRDLVIDQNDPRLPGLLAERKRNGRTKGELTFVRQDGTKFEAEMTSAIFITPDGQEQTSLFIQDITERKLAEEALQESEQRFRELLTNSIVGIFLATPGGEILYANPAACEMLGYTETELQAEGHTLIFDPNDPMVATLLSMREKTGRARGEVKFTRQDGTTFDVDLMSVIFTTPDGQRQASLFFQDITEHKQFEAELLQARKLESVGVLAGGIAHDFNNLLAGLSGNVELAQRVLDPTERAYRYLDSARYAIERATSLTKQLLTFAKGGTPIKELQNIGQLLADAATFAMHGSKSRLSLQIVPGLWLAEVDPGQISQVINNLIINARQAMPIGGTITVSAQNSQQGKQSYIEITVHDEGIGIPPENLDKIFDPYFSTKPENSGLGLATVHSIIAKHDGQIAVSSKLQKGSKFTLLLPASPLANLSQLGDSDEAVDAVPSILARILVLDDDEVVLTFIEGALKNMGHQVTATEEGQVAIDAYQTAMQEANPYQVVILDLTIPGGLSGQDVAQKILEFDPEAKLIVSSGYANNPVMAEYKEYGFMARLQKPYSLAILQQTLQTVLA